MSDLEGASYFNDHRRRKQSDAKLPTAGAPEHQRGMRSFLTWAFILAQIAAAEQIAGNAAANAATTDAAASAVTASDAAAGALTDAYQDIPADTEQAADMTPIDAAITPAHDASVSGHASAFTDNAIARDAENPAHASVGNSASAPQTLSNGSSADGEIGGFAVADAPSVAGQPQVFEGDVDVALDLGPIGGASLDFGPDHGVSLDITLLDTHIGSDLPLDPTEPLGPVATIVGSLLATADDLTAPVGDLVGDVSDTALDAVGNILTTATDLTASVGDLVGDVSDTALDTVGNLLTTATDLTASVGDLVGDVSDTALDTVGNLLTTATDLTASVGDLVGDIADAALDTVGNLLTTATDLTASVGDLVGDIADAALDTVGDLLTTATDLTTPIGNLVGNAADTALDTVDNVLTPAIDLTAPVGDLVGNVADDLLAPTGLGSLLTGMGDNGLLAGLDGAFGSAGIIELTNETSVGAETSDGMFDGAAYTDLNITLQSLLPGSPAVAVSTAGTTEAAPGAGLLDAILSIGAPEDDGGPLPGPTDIGSGIVASLGLDDATGGHHRSLADLFG